MGIDKIIIINLNLISIIQECSPLFISYERGKISGKLQGSYRRKRRRYKKCVTKSNKYNLDEMRMKIECSSDRV